MKWHLLSASLPARPVSCRNSSLVIGTPWWIIILDACHVYTYRQFACSENYSDYTVWPCHVRYNVIVDFRSDRPMEHNHKGSYTIHIQVADNDYVRVTLNKMIVFDKKYSCTRCIVLFRLTISIRNWNCAGGLSSRLWTSYLCVCVCVCVL